MRDENVDKVSEREIPEVLLGHVGVDALIIVTGAAALVIMVLMRYDIAARIIGVFVLFVCVDAGRYAYVLWKGRWKYVRGMIQSGYEKAKLVDSAKDFMFPGRTQDIMLVDDVSGQIYALAMSRRTKDYRAGMRVEAYLPDGGSEYVKDGIEYTFAYAISRLNEVTVTVAGDSDQDREELIEEQRRTITEDVSILEKKGEK